MEPISVKTVATVLGFIFLIISAAAAVDSRYATNSAVSLHVDRLQAAIYTLHYNELKEEIEFLEDKKRHGDISHPEKSRIDRLKNKLKAMDVEWRVLASEFGG